MLRPLDQYRHGESLPINDNDNLLVDVIILYNRIAHNILGLTTTVAPVADWRDWRDIVDGDWKAGEWSVKN